MQKHHISVCICTFKRPQLLVQLLGKLNDQRTDGLFTYSAVVADNDPAQSARQIVLDFSAASDVLVTYCFESRQNIALARNKALEHAQGDFIAFIDDDEFPVADWLYHLFKAHITYGADGVLGPVNPHFETDPAPRWAKEGKFFERPRYSSGYALTWSQCRTGNVLFRKEILSGVVTPFRPEFDTSGEDVDFFRRMTEKKYKFVWCDEAIAYEVVPASRSTRSYLLKRALLRGSNFPKRPTQRLKNASKSLIAVPCYVLALPVLALFGERFFLKYLIKLLDHVSRLLAYVGLRLVTRRPT